MGVWDADLMLLDAVVVAGVRVWWLVRRRVERKDEKKRFMESCLSVSTRWAASLLAVRQLVDACQVVRGGSSAGSLTSSSI